MRADMAATSGLTLAAAAADLSSDHGSVVLPLQVIIQGAILSAQAPLPDDSSGVRVLKVAGTLRQVVDCSSRVIILA